MKNIPLYSSNKALLMTLLITTLLVPSIFAQSLSTKQQSLFVKTEPIIIAEKGNYNVDETAQIFGMNFQSYERIRLNIKYINNSLRQEIPLTSFDIFADAKGNMSVEWKVLDVDQPDTTFIVLATGTSSEITTKAEFSTETLAGESVKISQCANSNATPQNMNCPSGGPAGWVTGLVGASKARYFEGDSIAYRNVMKDLVIGNSYKWTLEYDTTKGGINAIDYITTYNRSILNANPCADGAIVNGFCTAGAADSTLAIPIDPIVTQGRDLILATLDDVTQQPGNMSAWGATITSVSVPAYTGTYPGGDSTATVDITFTATSATAVLAWGGHASTRNDWGQTFGSVNITGAPYHISNGGLMNLTTATSCCTGSQDLSLQDAVVSQNATIRIIKHATPPSPQQFGFSATNLSPSAFTLVDNSSMTDGIQVFDNITTFNLKTITETSMGSYDLISIVCTVDIGTGGTPTPVRTGNSIAIDIKSGDVVTCTFNNDFVTAAAVSVAGKVLDLNGNGLGNAFVTITDSNGNMNTSRTNHFGNYKFVAIDAGENYLIEARHKAYVFPTQLISVNEEITNLNFFPDQ